MRLILGDCLEKLKELPDSSVDSVVTDPPAGIFFMGKDWDKDKGGRDEWIKWMSEIASECKRVIKPGGHALVWAIPRTSHWTATAWENAGFEVRDRIAHCFGSGFPKSLNVGKQEGCKEWEGWGTALKPAIEDWWLLRKPLSEKTVAENCLKWGVGGINVDGCRVGDSTARFPANLIHDGSDDVLGLFPETKGGIAVRRNSGGNTFGGDNPKPPMDDMGYGDSGSAARFFYCAKAGKKERNEGCEGLEERQPNHGRGHEAGGLQVSNACLPKRNHHPTVKPLALMRYLVRLVTPKGGVVLDPFMGSGTTGIACKREGMDFIGIEREAEYMKIAEARIGN